MNQHTTLIEEKDVQETGGGEVRARRGRARYVIPLLLAVIAIGAAAFYMRGGNKSAPAANGSPSPSSAGLENQAVAVTTAAAVRRSTARTVEVVGSLAADEEVVVSAQVAGELSSISVDFGSLVRQGQTIAQLDQRSPQLKVDQSQAAINQTLARLGIKEGDRFDPQKNADVRVAKSQLDWATMDLERSTRLVEKGDISRSTYDQAVINHQLASARHQAALDQVQQQLAVLEQQRATLQLARRELSDTVVRSPINGAVKEKLASRGMYLPVNGKIVTLVRLNPLRVRADVPESSAGNVRIGQTATFTVDSFPGRSFSARVVRIGPSLNEQTRALTVEAEVGNASNLLRPGMFARFQVMLNPNAAAVMVPKAAVQYTAGISKVFVIENGVVSERIVQTGVTDGDLVEVLSGVNEGEVVATSALDQVHQGSRVRQ
jgi:RND family efflux transporter MFP subunit